MFSYIKSWFAGPPPLSPEFLENLKKDTVTDKVVVYSKTYCPYCTSTKNLFQGLGQEFKLVELDINSNGSEIQRGLQELTGQRTVPNVFINGKHIGGNSDLQALNSSGKLKGLLA